MTRREPTNPHTWQWRCPAELKRRHHRTRGSCRKAIGARRPDARAKTFCTAVSMTVVTTPLDRPDRDEIDRPAPDGARQAGFRSSPVPQSPGASRPRHRRAQAKPVRLETGLIPTCADRHSIHRALRPARKERRPSWCGGTTRPSRRSRAGRRARPPVGRSGPPEGVAALARCPTSRGAPRLPGRPPRPMKWVSICAGWYYAAATLSRLPVQVARSARARAEMAGLRSRFFRRLPSGPGPRGGNRPKFTFIG